MTVHWELDKAGDTPRSPIDKEKSREIFDPTPSSSPTYTEGAKLGKLPSRSAVEGEFTKLEAVVASLNGERAPCGNANYMETRVREYHRRKELKHIPLNFLLRAPSRRSSSVAREGRQIPQNTPETQSPMVARSRGM
jgi:hypothetical protein